LVKGWLEQPQICSRISVRLTTLPGADVRHSGQAELTRYQREQPLAAPGLGVEHQIACPELGRLVPVAAAAAGKRLHPRETLGKRNGLAK
jgi:hypothetical protein